MSECKEVVIIIRPSFKKMLSDDACRAAVFNHFLYWIARKVKSGSEYWYGSFDEIWESLDRSWGLSKTIQEIKALVADGFIGQRRNPKNGWDQTRHYFFEKEQGETLRATCEKFGICLAHIGLSPDVLHLLEITNAFDENNKCICSNQQIDLLDLPDRFVESNDAIPKVSTKDYNKGLQQREREVADATARSQSSQEISQDDEDTVKKEVVYVQNQSHSGNPGNSSQPHLDTDRNSIPLDASLTSQKDVAQNGHAHQHPIVDNHSPVGLHQPESAQPEHRKEDTNKVGHPPAPSKAHVNTSPFPVPKRAKPQSNIMDEIPLTPDEQVVFDAWCSLFKVDVPLIPANAKASKQLVKPLQVWTGILDKSTAEVLKLIMNWAYKNDKNGYYKRGFKLYDAAREFEAWQSAQERPQGDKEESNEHKATQQPANAFIERCLDKDYNKRQLEKMRAENERRRQAQVGGVQ